jgi:TfoX/Sxy family transcriptional regulator of competence genes
MPLDEDVISTMKNLGDSEKALEHKWVIQDVQLDSDIKLDNKADSEEKSDPICSSAGCTQYKHKVKGLGYKIDYFVPHFGEDHAITQSKESEKTAEALVGHKWNWKDDGPGDDPVLYNFHKPADPDIVDSMKNLNAQEGIHGKWNLPPDDYFQVQTGEKVDAESDPICSSAGCTQYKHKTKGLGYKINYGVPDFGRDHDINHNFDSLDTAEKIVGHKWVWTKDPPADDPVEYDVNKPLDPEIVHSLGNLKAQEGIHGQWKLHPDDYFQVQTDEQSESDPICSSAGCTQYKHKKKPLGYKINYPVPNFGVDTDILDNHHSLSIAEAMKSHGLQLGTEASKAKWHNPANDVDYNFVPKLDGDIISTNKNLADTERNLGHHWALAVQLDSDVKTNGKSDPICSSAGCPKSEYTEAEEAKIVQYPAPEPLDSDILHTHAHEAAASSKLGHKWVVE